MRDSRNAWADWSQLSEVNPKLVFILALRSLRGLLEYLLDRGLLEYLLVRLDVYGLLARRGGLLVLLGGVLRRGLKRRLGLGLLNGGSILVRWGLLE